MNELNESPVEPSLSVGYVAATIAEYGRALMVLWLSLCLIGLILALLVVLLTPSTRITNVPFRLRFTGADVGQYPNGTPFNSTEIVATPVLLKAFQMNGLDRYTTFEKFRTSMFVSEQNAALDRLAAMYEPRFADPRLGPVDRQRLEEEYQLKRASIGRSEFALNLVREESLKVIPDAIAGKVISNVLSIWAEQAVSSRGVISLGVPLVDPASFTDESGGRNFLIAADMLRRRAIRLGQNIDLLLDDDKRELPPAAQATVRQLRVELDELRRFRIDPLVSVLAAASESHNAQTTMFVESAANDARRDRDEATARIDTIRQAMSMYQDQQQRQQMTAPMKRDGEGGSETRTVTPQVSDAFLNQLVDLVANSKDQKFRQEVAGTFTKEAEQNLIPNQQQVAYYEAMLAALRGGGGAMPADAPAQYLGVLGRTRDIAARLRAVYASMAEELNPGGSIYSVTSAPITRHVRAANILRLLTFWLLFVLLSIPLLIAGALLHKRARRDVMAADHLPA